MRFIYTVLFITTLIYAQEVKLKFPLEYYSENSLFDITQLKALEEEYTNSHFAFIYKQHLATLYSFIGEQKKSMHYFPHSKKKINQQQKTIVDKLVNEYKVANAISEIVTKAENTQAVFINEAHHVPQHRFFSILLLHELKNKGYRYFAAETFANNIKKANQRKYPLRTELGAYPEPVYGLLVRTALDLGYTLVPYEKMISMELRAEEAKKGRAYVQNMREVRQAKGLQQIFIQDPKAKIVVHAGYAHIYEADNPKKWVSMAVNFRKLTGHDPLTINQTTMTERYTLDHENPIYRSITSQLKFQNAIVFKKNESIWSLKTLGKSSYGYDIEVFHPRTVYEHNRPQWLFYKDKKKHFIDCPYQNILVQVFQKKEYNKHKRSKLMPIEQFFNEKNKKVMFLLSTGEYIVDFINTDNKVLSSTNISVK